MEFTNVNQQNLIGNCIHCEGTVRVPTSASPTAQVKCPRCGEMFLLGAVLDQAAPSLEIIDHRPTTIADVPIVDRVLFEEEEPAVEEKISIEEKPKKFEVPAALRNGAKRKRRRRSSRNGSSSSSRDSSRSSRGESSRRESSSRRQSSEDSRPAEIISPPPEQIPTPELNGIETSKVEIDSVPMPESESRSNEKSRSVRPSSRPR